MARGSHHRLPRARPHEVSHQLSVPGASAACAPRWTRMVLSASVDRLCPVFWSLLARAREGLRRASLRDSRSGRGCTSRHIRAVPTRGAPTPSVMESPRGMMTVAPLPVVPWPAAPPAALRRPLVPLALTGELAPAGGTAAGGVAAPAPSAAHRLAVTTAAATLATYVSAPWAPCIPSRRHDSQLSGGGGRRHNHYDRMANFGSSFFFWEQICACDCDMRTGS